MIIGVYLRLSDDDNDIRDFKQESNSISAQRNLINSYISNSHELCGSMVKEFCDDGYTGVNFKRPSVQKLFDEVRKGTVQCVIVKDLSRFGRNHIEVGDYLEQIFPLLNVRFIAINDNYDSINNIGTAGMETAFKNLMNENYSRDISMKVKSVKNIQKQKGLFIGNNAAYGYIAKDKKLIIDEPAAKVVRRIFEMADNGMRYFDIAQTLNKEGIPSRIDYLKGTSGIHFWSKAQISQIVHNKIYIGTYICNKNYTIAPRVRKFADESELIVFENHHEPIISKELFESVSRRFYKSCEKGIKKTSRGYDEFNRKVICGGCGKALHRNYSSIKDISKRTFYYKCNYITDDNCCLDKIFIEDLKLIVINMFETYMNIAISDFNSRKDDLNNRERTTKTNIEKINAQIEKLEKRKLIAYTEYKEKLLSKEKYLDKREKISNSIDKLKTEKEKLLADFIPSERFNPADNIITEYKNKKLTEKIIIDKFVKKIWIYSINRIEIDWNFDDIFSLK